VKFIDEERKVHGVELICEMLPIAPSDYYEAKVRQIHHRDRVSQYLSIQRSEHLTDAGIDPSVGSKGDSYDSAWLNR
jgi:transposase InsO family protein